jgi:hypothetical protein
MLNNESVAKPMGIELNMLVNPFLCLWRQWEEQEHGAFIAYQYIGRNCVFDFHVISFAGPFHLPHLPLVGRPPWNAVLSSVGGDAALGTPLLMRD